MRALICFHGLLSNKNDFNNIVKKLAPYYDYIACFDLPGHGHNRLKFNTKNVKQFVLDIYDSVAINHTIIDVIGYSMGGVIACYLQCNRKVNRLVLLAPAYRYLNLKNYQASLHTSANEAKVVDLLPRKNYFHLFSFTKLISDLSTEFKIIYPETLIIWGKNDFLVKEESGWLLYNMIRNKTRQYIEIDGHNHFNIVNSNTVLNIVEKFLIWINFLRKFSYF